MHKRLEMLSNNEFTVFTRSFCEEESGRRHIRVVGTFFVDRFKTTRRPIESSKLIESRCRAPFAKWDSMCQDLWMLIHIYINVLSREEDLAIPWIKKKNSLFFTLLQYSKVPKLSRVRFHFYTNDVSQVFRKKRKKKRWTKNAIRKTISGSPRKSGGAAKR